MESSCLADRMARYVPLTDRERRALARLEANERSVRRGALIWREHGRAGELFVVKTGWLMSHVLLADGARQIIRLHLPGEIVGLGSLVVGRTTESVAAVADARLGVFDKALLRALFDEHPRLAALILSLGQVERVALTDRLASLGRTSARSRIAALILDTLARLRIADPAVRASFDLPLTQEEIGDATGLTAVHVNRMMRALAAEGMIARAGSRIEVVDERRLARIAHHVDRYDRLDAAWLPASR